MSNVPRTLAIFLYFFIKSKDRRLLLLLALALMFPFTTFILSTEDDLPRQQGLIATSLDLYGDMEPKVPVTNSSTAYDSNVSPNLLIAETNTISVLERCASLLIYLRSKVTSLLARIPTLQEPPAAGKVRVRWTCVSSRTTTRCLRHMKHEVDRPLRPADNICLTISLRPNQALRTN